jgi:uncharacterized protein (TIGR03905 family)
MRTIEYTPKNVCSQKMVITVDGDIVKHVEIYAGCHGNRQVVSRLVEGLTIDEVIEKLDGIECRGSRTGKTSCPDQLAQALKTLK